MKKVDARGLDCPKPVIETKKAIDGGFGEILVMVDNETARKNIERLAEKMNYETEEERSAEGISLMLRSKGATAGETPGEAGPKTGDWVLLAATDKMGEGSDELGQILLRGYFYALTESQPYPRAMLLLNGGIRLALEGSPVIESLKTLGEKGVEILVCGTCLDYFDEKKNLRIGTVSNMYDIVEKMQSSGKVIRI